MEVVAAVITAGDFVLACRRAQHKASAGLWEFPGGKIEGVEDALSALARELQEELGLLIHDAEHLDTSTTDGLTLHCFTIRVDHQFDVVSTDHDAFAWLPIQELAELDFCKPDLPAVQKLLSGKAN